MLREWQLNTHAIAEVNERIEHSNWYSCFKIRLVSTRGGIIINAYSTNDMHFLTMMEAQKDNTILRDKGFEMIHEFVRRVMEPQAQQKRWILWCQPPATPADSSG